MNDNEIKAALAEVGAGWLMDSSDEHCQSAAMRHLVDAVEAAERERCARSMKLADDRLAQMQTDRDQALRWKVALEKSLTVCRCAARVVDSSAYQGVSDEDCDLENAVRNWRTI